MANISRELQAIEDAIYGEEVRGSIHDAIAKINEVSESSDTTAQNANITAESAKATAINAEKIAEIKSGTAVTSVTSPITGMVKNEMYFNTATNDLWKCNGVGWDLIGNLKGIKGDKGEDAPKPTGIVLVSQVGLIKTYNITFSDGSLFPFQVSDGASGTGTGDMLKAVYDRDNSGVIDAAETLVEKTNGKVGQTAVLVELSKDSDGDLNFEGKKIKGGGGGTGGATLRIVTTEPDFINKPVRATLISGSTSSAYFIDSSFDSDGKCEIVVNEVGTYKIAVTADKEYSVTKEIPYFGIYPNIMLAKFKAYIPVSVNGGVLVGEGVTVTASDGSATYSAVTGLDGKATIQVGKSGIYTVRASKGTVTTASTGTSTITTDGQEANLVVLYFASITLNYECDTAITYEVKKDGFSKTGADNKNGSDTFLVPSLGEYQIVATIDGKEVTASVNVSKYENTVASIKAKKGDFAGWVHTRFSSSSASSLSDLTEEQIRELMTVHASQDNLYEWLSATPTDFEQFASNRLAMKWIGLRDRICDKLMGVSDILTAMLASEHWEYILKDSVPKMTTDNTPYGEAFSNPVYSGGDAFKAFDADDTTSYISNTIAQGYIGYKFAFPIIIKKMMILASNGGKGRLKDYEVQASNVGNFGGEETIIHSGTLQDGDVTQVIDINNDTPYLYYRVLCKSTYNSNMYFAVWSLNFYGRALNESVPVMTSNTEPIGEVINTDAASAFPAYQCFDGGKMSGSYHTNYITNNPNNDGIGYRFTKPIKLKQIRYIAATWSGKDYLKDYEVWGSEDGTNFDTLITSGTHANIGSEQWRSIDVNTDKAMRAFKVLFKSDTYNAGEYGFAELNFYGVSYSEEEFAEGSTIKYIYDHGLELEEISTKNLVTKNPSDMLLTGMPSNQSTNFTCVETATKFDTTPYKLCRATISNMFSTYAGLRIYQELSPDTGKNNSGIIASGGGTAPNNIIDPINWLTADISAVNQPVCISLYVGRNMSTGTSYFSINKWWLE